MSGQRSIGAPRDRSGGSPVLSTDLTSSWISAPTSRHTRSGSSHSILRWPPRLERSFAVPAGRSLPATAPVPEIAVPFGLEHASPVTHDRFRPGAGRVSLALRRHLNHADRRGPTGAARLHWRRLAFRGAAERACAMPRKGTPAPTDADDRFPDSRHLRRTLASNGEHQPAPRASREGAGSERGRGHVGHRPTLAVRAGQHSHRSFGSPQQASHSRPLRRARLPPQGAAIIGAGWDGFLRSITSAHRGVSHGSDAAAAERRPRPSESLSLLFYAACAAALLGSRHR